MTDLQREDIITLRSQGYGYKKIGQLTGVSVSTVKLYCQKNDLGGYASDLGRRCKCCRAPLVQTPGRKRKIFCSSACRNKWWNSHPELLHHRDGRTVSCAYCGQTFTVRKNSTQKYCSHACYVADRFHTGDLL